MHEAYCGNTGLTVKLNAHRIEAWKRWIDEGFAPDDLRAVIKYIKQKIRDGVRREESFKFDLLITPDRYKGFSRFEDDLAMANKVFRKRSDKPVDRAVQTPNGVVHYQDHESTPPPKRFSLEEIAESIKKGGRQ